MNTHFSEDFLKKSIERALTGQTPENLVALTAEVESQRIKLVAYFDEQVTEDNTGTISPVAAEVIADFPEQLSIEEDCLTSTSVLPKMLQFRVYRR